MVSSEPRRPFLEAGQEERDLQRYLDLVLPVVSRYEHVTCIGVSSGARMSLVAAPRVAARRAIAIGVQGAPQSPLLRDPQFREIALVHAAGHSGDSESAVSWQHAVGGVRVAVPGIEEHNVLAPLKARGELDPFLSWLLEGDLAVPPEWRN
jgi:hypothetical protein